MSVDFDASQREAQAAAGVPARKRGAGVGAQIALARRDSPVRGGRHLGLAKALVREMPHALEPAVADAIDRELRAIGYRHVTLDLRGYRLGSLNDALRLRPV